MNWQEFVIEYGARVSQWHLAHILGQSAAEIETLRRRGVCKPRPRATGVQFAELFSLWHGREPAERDWPVPRRSRAGAYEWLPPEDALLASLIGRMGINELASVLTHRLRLLTGENTASRNKTVVQNRINRLHLKSSDVVGGITPHEAGREIGATSLVYQVIHNRQLKTRKVGNRLVIPYADWEAWKASRVFPPKGFVQLSTLRERLSIKSDKLSEFARMGYIPSAIRCNPYGMGVKSTQFGTWYVSPKVATRLLADRRAGRPMPWHGKPQMDNLRATYRLWSERKHPKACDTCRHIWGEAGAPRSLDDYVQRYPPLAHGAKRHLTMKWSPGLTIQEVGELIGIDPNHVRRAIDNRMLEVAHTVGRKRYISRTAATLWKERKCPTGEGSKSWISLDMAERKYGFTRAELKAHVLSDRLPWKLETNGPARGQLYVARHGCASLRAKLGYTEAVAARMAGVTVPRLRVLLRGATWREGQGIPLMTVQAVIKRVQSKEGMTIPEAARHLRRSEEWVNARIQEGVVRIQRAKWDRRRRYLTQPMVHRLEQYKANPHPKKVVLSSEWIKLGDAVLEAGVSQATLDKWARAGEIQRQPTADGNRYQRHDVRQRARRYWKTARWRRPTLPAWLSAERETKRKSP